MLINLASQEYFKAVRPELLDARAITPVFRTAPPAVYRVVMVFAKQQRGRMARHIIQHRLMEPEPLKMYREDGYLQSRGEHRRPVGVPARQQVTGNALRVPTRACGSGNFAPCSGR